MSFCVCCWAGVGTQFLAIVSGILLMALLGMFNVHRHGSINAAAILLYAFTSCELAASTPVSPVAVRQIGLYRVITSLEKLEKSGN